MSERKHRSPAGLFLDTFRDGPFLRKIVTVALPVALQNLLNTVTNMVDTIMIGGLGASTIAAVGLANKYFFVFGLLVFGICSGSSVLAAQFWGNRDVVNIRKVMGLALIMSAAGSLVFFLPALLLPERVMRIFTSSMDAVQIGARYLRIVSFTYLLTAVAVVMTQLMRTVGRASRPVLTSMLAIAVNIFLNYALIFGHFGMPAMGVEGAAVATLIARIVEVLALSMMTFSPRSVFKGPLRDFIGWSPRFIQSYLSTSVPVIFNEFIWGLGTTMYSVAYGRMGDDAVAAVTIAATIEEMMTVLWMGLSAATAVLLGNELGAGKLGEAEDHAAKFCMISLILSFAAMLVLWLIRYPVTGLFHVSPEVEVLVIRCLNRFLMVFIPKMMNFIIIVGILRAGGDTKWCLFIDTSGVWAVGVPLAFLGALYWKLPIDIVYFLVSIEEIYKVFFGLWRVGRKKWLRNLAIEVQ